MKAPDGKGGAGRALYFAVNESGEPVYRVLEASLLCTAHSAPLVR